MRSLNKLVLTKMLVKGKLVTVSALVDEKGVLEFRPELPMDQGILGNIYVAQVENVAENIQAAFVQIQPGVRCYLPLSEAAYAIYAGNGTKGTFRPGDEILVQVKREAMKSKLPCVTTNLNFTGKYLVLTSGNHVLGFSAKLSREEKGKLKEWLSQVKLDSYGLVVRTNAGEASKEEILRELERLEQRFRQVISCGVKRTCFSLLEKAQEAWMDAVRDAYTQELQEIITDDPEIYERLSTILPVFSKEGSEQLRLYQDKLLPLYKLYRLEHALEEAVRERVWLGSGGFLVIQQTEAFVSIDVNTGKYTGKKKAEETFRKINREAAAEIARQLRLRNLSGIILIDFINMENPDHQNELLHVLDKQLRRDPVKAQVIDMTALHIVEVTRKKVRRSLAEDLARISIQ